jgi:hypothetical protein
MPITQIVTDISTMLVTHKAFHWPTTPHLRDPTRGPAGYLLGSREVTENLSRLPLRGQHRQGFVVKGNRYPSYIGVI